MTSENPKYDTTISIKGKYEKLKRMSESRVMHDVSFRITQLKKLRASFVKYEKEIHESNKKDLGFSEFASYFSSYSIVLRDIEYVIANIKEWTSPRPVDTPLILAPAKSYILPEPLGVSLIMSAWNTQFQTLIMPIAQSIAAGNVIFAKPSEMSPAAAVVCEIILGELDEGVVEIVHGGGDVCEEILKYRFDIILYTGSPQKGVLVAKAAAEFLTPTILELGGQNPVIIDKTVKIENCAYSIVNGRFCISGQVCIAPEYLFIEREVYDKVVTELKSTTEIFFSTNPKNSKDYSRIINKFHAERLAKLIPDAKGKLLIGGDHDVDSKYISPTMIEFDSIEELSKSSLAKGEIFGPILYFAPYDNLDDAIKYINDKEKPLVIYYFGENQKTKEKIIKATSSGAFVTNTCIEHFINEQLPFGGVGNSGNSAYHGISGFNNLSHLKPVMEKSQMLVKSKFPPFTESRVRMMKTLMPFSHLTQNKFLKTLLWTSLLLIIFYFRNSLYSLLNSSLLKQK